jgi:hypothetical protein
MTASERRLGRYLFLATALTCAPCPVAGQHLNAEQNLEPHRQQMPHPGASVPHLRTSRPVLPTHIYRGQTYRGRIDWDRGHWHHARRMGRFGWWWDVGGIWYFYPEPSEEPPQGPPASISNIQDENVEPRATRSPPPPEEPQRAFYYRPGDLQGVPYDTLEECTAVQKQAGNGVCVVK